MPATQDETWKKVLGVEREKPYFQEVLHFVERERAKGKQIFPKNSEVFQALTLTPLHEVKVVILGQDPYHGPGQAHGLCFSVKQGVQKPPSLENIFKELESDLGLQKPKHGNLENWAQQGVLLLNAVLTVEAGKPGSHANRGWEQFTDRVVSELNEQCYGLVFLLWGSYAQKKGSIINRTRHVVLQAPHPSPLSAHRGFFGCRHFSKTNDALRKFGKKEIHWELE
ncbi:MAG: uracil-DNA glycosylase [Bdellovibrionales bacterium]|nr:uracil-DNA glycosylase [Bdellovibrionales bacterium]